MLVVVLGAGASYDSVNLEAIPTMPSEARPPLAKDLFESRSLFVSVIDKYPEVQYLASRLRRATLQQKDFEQTLEELQEEYKSNSSVIRQLGALRFYLRDIISASAEAWSGSAHGVTNYLDLVQTLENWRQRHNERITYITFNYDDLLERALYSLGNRFETMDDYIKSARTGVIKPHGSTTWSELARMPNVTGYDHSANYVISRFETLEFINEPYFTGNKVSLDTEGSYLNIPAIAVPVNTKTTFVCPKGHLDIMDEALKTADRVLTIGWRGNEQHFRKRWKDNLRGYYSNSKILIVSGSEEGARETASKLNDLGLAFPKTLGGGFSNLFDSPDFKSFLA